LPADLGPDFSATLHADTHSVTLFAVNDTVEAVTRTLDFSAFGSGPKSVSVWTLADSRKAGEPDAVNSFDEPGRITARESHRHFASLRFNYRFPELSLTVLQIKYR
jgi:alpha-L-arabinofuranosidase